MHKNIILAALIISMAGAAVSCGSSNENNNEAGAETVTTAAVTTTKVLTTPIVDDEPIERSPKDVIKKPRGKKVFGYGLLEVEPVLQLPELPTGCEITSLTTVMNYAGFAVTKEELADDYLTTADPFKATFDEAFILTPRMPEAYGCNAPVIVKAAEDYFKKNHENWGAYDLTGTDFNSLFYQIDEGRPVVIWASMGLLDVKPTLRWTTDDGKEAWFAEGEHCMALKGYDIDADRVYVCDPLKGNMEYSLSRFAEVYDMLGKQALVIYDKEILLLD